MSGRTAAQAPYSFVVETRKEEFASGEAASEIPACHISYGCCLPPTFIAFDESIKKANQRAKCDMKLEVYLRPKRCECLRLIRNTVNPWFTCILEITDNSKECLAFSLTCTYVWVALATSDAQSILEIPATDEIHMEDQNHGFASRTVAYTTRVKGYMYIWIVWYQNNQRRNKSIHWSQKHKLDQIVARNKNFSRPVVSMGKWSVASEVYVE